MQLRSISNPREKAWGWGRKMENGSPENGINDDKLGNIVLLPKARLNPCLGVDTATYLIYPLEGVKRIKSITQIF